MEYNINEDEVQDVKTEATKVTGCKTCKKRLSNTQLFLIFVSVYILLSSIFGTVVMLKYLVDLFN
jgi:hypothetical protein